MHFERLYRLDIVIASLVRFFSLRYSLQDVVGYFAAGNWALYRRSTGGVPTADPAEFRTHRPVANELPAVRAARSFGPLRPVVADCTHSALEQKAAVGNPQVAGASTPAARPGRIPGWESNPSGVAAGKSPGWDHRPFRWPARVPWGRSSSPCQSPAVTPRGVPLPVGAERHYFGDQVQVLVAGRQATARRGLPPNTLVVRCR